VTYRDAGDLREKIEFYLANEVARRQIAEKGYALVTANHTFENRVHTIMAYMGDLRRKGGTGNGVGRRLEKTLKEKDGEIQYWKERYIQKEAELNRTINNFQQSLSWKITGPLRTMHMFLFGKREKKLLSLIKKEPEQVSSSDTSSDTSELIPPKEMLFDGGHFKEVGEYFLRFFVDNIKLKPDEKILDVGCGIGRVAVPLTRYLNEKGLYEGFDIVAKGINWCRENIASRYPNFHFQLADVFNKTYNPQGKHRASDYRFPYEDEYFDFVFLTSVFTHMLPRDMEHYLVEISRVLKTNGRCLITFFLMKDGFRERANDVNAALDFQYKVNQERTVFYVTDKNSPENAIAFDEEYIRSLYKNVNLRIVEPVTYGFQDIIIAEKIC
jgi:ubiquinone/menaquinone biosynthesis C-methylase UbiE